MNIRQEITQLANFYAIDTDYVQATLSGIALDEYVEYVLAADDFDIVVGGFNQANALLMLAHKQGFPESVIQIFEACIRQYPQKMLYAKLSMSPQKKDGTLYLGILESWQEVLQFLGQFPDFSLGISQLASKPIPFQLCFLLAFSADSVQQPIAKIYHLLPQQNGNQPFLKAYRVSKTGLSSNEKNYSVIQQWQQPNSTSRWQVIHNFAEQLVGNNYAIHIGKTTEGEQKTYIFRYDKRETTMYSHKNYNYYVEEGNQLLLQNKSHEALPLFENAVKFNLQDAIALNGLGFCLLNTGRFLEGIEYVLQAKAINPKISNLVWALPVPSDIDNQIEQLSQQIAGNSEAALHNQRGVLHFLNKNYPQAIEDFKKALEYKPLFAEYLSNLGGAYLKSGSFVEALKCCNTALTLTGNADNNLTIVQDALRLLGLMERNPTPENCNNYGILLYKLDMFEKAKEAFSLVKS